MERPLVKGKRYHLRSRPFSSSYIENIEAEDGPWLYDPDKDIEARLKEAEDLLRSTLDKLYRLDFSKGSRLSMLIDDLEEALKGLGKEPCYICKGIGQHELFYSRGRQENKS